MAGSGRGRAVLQRSQVTAQVVGVEVMRAWSSGIRHANAPHGHAARQAILLLVGWLAAWHCMAAPWRVVVVPGADPTQPAAVEQIRALRQSIEKASPGGAEFYIDALDGLRFDSAQLMPAFVELLKLKYRRQKVDIVIGLTESALAFTERYHQEIWPGVPVLIASIDEGRLKERGLPPDFAYLPFRIDVDGTLDIIRALQPASRRLVVVAGTAPFDKYWAQRTLDTAARRQQSGQGWKSEAWIGLPQDELRARLASLDKSAAVVYTSMYRDRNGRSYFPYEVVGPAAEASKAPIYGWYGKYLEHGLTGGIVLNFTDHGRRTAELALSILRGEVPAAGATLPPGSGHCMVNIGQMEALGLATDGLPAGCEEVNLPPSIWREHRGFMLVTLAMLLLQGLTISALLWQRRRRYLAESEAMQRRNELSRAARVASVGELSASIAHEVNQPLGANLSNAAAGGMMLDAGPLDTDEMRQILVDVRRDAMRASQIVQRQRAMLQRHDPELVMLAPDAVLEEGLQLLLPEAARRRCELRTDLQARQVRIMGDPIQLQQILLNLVINAMDACEEMGPERRQVTVATREADGCYVLRVRDRGHGIAAEAAARIFESFFTTKAHGIGLGLSIVRTIVTAHGGRVSVTPNDGGGTVFEIRIPTRQAAPPSRARPSPGVAAAHGQTGPQHGLEPALEPAHDFKDRGKPS